MNDWFSQMGYEGLLPQQQPVSYWGSDYYDDQMSVSLVEETGVPGENHQPTIMNEWMKKYHSNNDGSFRFHAMFYVSSNTEFQVKYKQRMSFGMCGLGDSNCILYIYQSIVIQQNESIWTFWKLSVKEQ